MLCAGGYKTIKKKHVKLVSLWIGWYDCEGANGGYKSTSNALFLKLGGRYLDVHFIII